MTTIDLNNRNQYPIRINSGSAQVWTKARWSLPFTLRPDLTPVQSVWVASPDFNTAALEYRYGRVLVPGASQYSTLTKITARGYWVLIRWQSDNGSPIDWLGYAETPITRDHHPARDNLPETGKQSIRCFGLMRALQQRLIDTTVYVDPASETLAKRSGGTGAIFNEGSRGNRSTAKRKLDPDGTEAYVFAHPNDDQSEWWSTRDIVEHIATFHLPTPNGDRTSNGVPWQVNNLSVLPNWDRPSLDSDLRDVASVLNELVDPSKMLGWGIGISGTEGSVPTIDSVTINPFSLLADPLVVPGGTIPANEQQFEIAWISDPLTTIQIDEDASGVVDQIIVQGPREISVCTLTGHPEADSTHIKGWTTEDESTYSDGARFASGFSTASIESKRQMNERFRTSGAMRNVYSLYRLKNEWNGKIGNSPVFLPIGEGQSAEVYIPAPHNIELIDHLPLFREVDYTGDPTQVDESLGLTLQQPLFTMRVRDANSAFTGVRLYVDPTGKLSQEDELLKSRPFLLSYEFEDGINIRLIVRDGPQHAIAGKAFIGNHGDLDQETIFGDIHHSGWGLTIAIRGDRRPRFVFPSVEIVNNLDVVRRKIITLDDDALASVYIVQGAIVGFKKDNPNAVTSPGGLLRDPTPMLESICNMIAKQHLEPRRRAEIRTARRLPQLQLGSLVRNIESANGPVNAPISEIRIDSPMSDGEPIKGPSQSFVCSPYRFDVLSLLRQPVSPVQASKGRKGEKRVIKPRNERRPIVPIAERRAKRGLK